MEIHFCNKLEKHNANHIDRTELKETAKSLTDLFSFAKDLKIGDNLQPTTTMRSLSRWVIWSKEYPIQRSYAYTPLSAGYSLESFNQVMGLFDKGITEANQIFRQTLLIARTFNANQGYYQEQVKNLTELNDILETSKVAFKVFAASRTGFHLWAQGIEQWHDCEVERKIQAISKIIDQQNQVISSHFEEALLLDSERKAFFFGIERTISTNEPLDEKLRGSHLRRLHRATQEFLEKTNHFIDQLTGYEAELSARKDQIIHTERLQISGFEKLLASAKIVQEQIQAIALDSEPSLKEITQAIDQIHRLFVQGLGGEIPQGTSFVAQLMTATTEIDPHSRSSLPNLVPDKTLHQTLPHSAETLWPILCFQQLTSRFTMPLEEMKRNLTAIQSGSSSELQLNGLIQNFKIASGIANGTMI